MAMYVRVGPLVGPTALVLIQMRVTRLARKVVPVRTGHAPMVAALKQLGLRLRFVLATKMATFVARAQPVAPLGLAAVSTDCVTAVAHVPGHVPTSHVAKTYAKALLAVIRPLALDLVKLDKVAALRVAKGLAVPRQYGSCAVLPTKPVACSAVAVGKFSRALDGRNKSRRCRGRYCTWDGRTAAGFQIVRGLQVIDRLG